MEKKISKKTLSKSFHHWYYGNLTCFSQEHMQTFGYLTSMLPIIEELYDKKEDQAKALKTYTAFFNTEPQLGTVIVGVTAGLEEARANGAQDVDDETINGLRAGLMGPIAGIGDSLVVGTVIPILLGIALGFAEGGSPIGPLFYIVVWNATSIWFQHFVYFKGYELGGSAVELLVGEKATAFRESVLVMGQVIVGAMAASWVSISTNLVITRSYDQATGKLTNVTLGEKLDGAFPKVLTMAFVLFAWWLMAKKNVTPVKVLLLFVVIGFVGSVVGFLG